jgi:hypothetical protein
VSAATESLFADLRQRKGCIVQRPGDEEPGWWLLLRDGELRGLFSHLDRLEMALAESSTHVHDCLDLLTPATRRTISETVARLTSV